MESSDLLTNDLQVSPYTLSYLGEAARWGKFLAIMGFILCGMMLIIAFLLPAVVTKMPPYNSLAASYTSGIRAGLTIVYSVFSVVLFFPCLYLYKFSEKMQSAVKTTDQENFDESLRQLKSMFKFFGVFTIIILSLYALIFIVGVISAAIR